MSSLKLIINFFARYFSRKKFNKYIIHNRVFVTYNYNSNNQYIDHKHHQYYKEFFESAFKLEHKIEYREMPVWLIN